MLKYALVLAASISIVLATPLRSPAEEFLYARVSDQGLKRFDLAGNLLDTLHLGGDVFDVDRQGNLYVSTWGGVGAFRHAPDGTLLSFYAPTPIAGDVNIFAGGVAFGPDGNVYLGVRGAPGRNRIERFAVDGTSLGVFTGTAELAQSLAFDDAGNLVAGGGQIQKFDPSGTLLGTFGSHNRDVTTDATGNIYATTDFSSVLVFNSIGQFTASLDTGMRAVSIDFDENGIIYVGGWDEQDSTRPIIRRYLADGSPLGDFVILPANTRVSEVSDLVVVNVIPEPTGLILATGAFCVALLRRESYARRTNFVSGSRVNG